jgi:hypothetical protein
VQNALRALSTGSLSFDRQWGLRQWCRSFVISAGALAPLSDSCVMESAAKPALKLVTGLADGKELLLHFDRSFLRARKDATSALTAAQPR